MLLRIRTLLRLLGMATAICSLSLVLPSTPAAAADLGWAYSTPKKFTGPAAYNSWPVLSGDVLAFSSGPRHEIPTTRVVVLRTPAGETVLRGRGEDLSIFSLGRTPAGRLVGLVRVVTASTWRYRTLTGTDLDWPFKPVVISPILTLRSGEMIAHWHSGSESGSPSAWGLVRSTDGEVWTQEVKGRGEQLSGIPVEGRMVETGGQVLLLARNQNTGGGLWQATSSDGGRTFTTPVETNITDGRLTPPAVIADRYGLAVYYFDRRERVIRVRRTSGVPAAKAWPASSLVRRGIRSGRPHDSGYVHVTPSRNGHLLAWYEGNPRSTTVYTMLARPCTTRPSGCR